MTAGQTGDRDQRSGQDSEERRRVGSATVRAGAITLIGQWVRFATQIGGLIVLARLLSPSDYGLVSMVTAIVGIATILGDFGFSLAAIQARVLSREQKSNLFWLNATFGLCAALAVLFLRHPIAGFYHRPKLVGIVAALSATFLLNGLTTQFEAEMTRGLMFTRLAMRDITAAAVGSMVAIIMALLHCGYWSLIAQQLVTAGIALGMSVYLSRWWPGLPSRRAPMRALLSFGSNALGTQVAAYVSTNVDNVFIGKFWGAVNLGLYSRAYTLFGLPLQQLAAPLTRVVLPTMAKLPDDESSLDYLLRGQLLLSYGVGGVLALGLGVAQPLIVVALGSRWTGATGMFQALAVGGIFQVLQYFYYWTFLWKAKPNIQLRFSLLGRGALIVLMYVGVRHSTVLAAWGVTAGNFVLWLLFALPGVRQLGIRPWPLLSNTLRPLVSLLAAVVVTQVFLRLAPRALPAFGELCLASLVFVAVVAALAVSSTTIRADLNTLWRTAMLVRHRSDSGVNESS